MPHPPDHPSSFSLSPDSGNQLQLPDPPEQLTSILSPPHVPEQEVENQDILIPKHMSPIMNKKCITIGEEPGYHRLASSKDALTTAPTFLSLNDISLRCVQEEQSLLPLPLPCYGKFIDLPDPPEQQQTHKEQLVPNAVHDVQQLPVNHFPLLIEAQASDQPQLLHQNNQSEVTEMQVCQQFMNEDHQLQVNNGLTQNYSPPLSTPHELVLYATPPMQHQHQHQPEINDANQSCQHASTPQMLQCAKNKEPVYPPLPQLQILSDLSDSGCLFHPSVQNLEAMQEEPSEHQNIQHNTALALRESHLSKIEGSIFQTPIIQQYIGVFPLLESAKPASEIQATNHLQTSDVLPTQSGLINQEQVPGSHLVLAPLSTHHHHQLQSMQQICCKSNISHATTTFIASS